MPCWAETIGGCGGGVSREHIISRSQFEDDQITVQGLPWCKDQPKTVGLASLVARNLCRDHNTALSPVDGEAARLNRALKVLFHQPSLPVRVQFEARILERWVLKTTINLALQDDNSGLTPTPELVRRAFGQEPAPKGEGLFMIVEEGETLRYAHGLRFESMVRRDNGQMVLGAFVFHGVRLLYAFDGAPAVRGALRARMFEWKSPPSADAPPVLAVLGGSSHWIRFRWRPAFDADDVIMDQRPVHTRGSLVTTDR
jgi:hypothetical protein